MAAISRYHTILWDVDGTLLNFIKSERYAITFCFQKFGLEINEEIAAGYSLINDRFWKKLERGEVDKKTLLIGRFQELFEQFGIIGTEPEAFQSEYQTALGSVYFYLDHSYELCKSLQGKYRQYIVTNGVSCTQRNKLHLSGFDAIMDGIFISEEIGVPKPGKEFFEACFSQIPDFRHSETMIIGDSLTSDILGGRNAGITACWYNPGGLCNPSDIKEDIEIKKLQDILNYLD